MKVDYVDEDVVWNKLFKKECFGVICFPKGRVFEEHATLYKIFSETDSVISIPQKLYHYRIREGSISHTRTMKHLVDFGQHTRRGTTSLSVTIVLIMIMIY